jgi:hypothetical protein
VRPILGLKNKIMKGDKTDLDFVWPQCSEKYLLDDSSTKKGEDESKVGKYLG